MKYTAVSKESWDEQYARIIREWSKFLSEQTKHGMRLKAESGELPGAAPLGYLNLRRGAKAWVEVDPIVAPLVKEAFELAATERYSMRELLTVMTKKGLRSKRGNPMGLAAFRRMLINQFYISRIRYGQEYFIGKHIPLVNEGTFAKAGKNLR